MIDIKNKLDFGQHMKQELVKYSKLVIAGLSAVILQSANACSWPTAHQCNWTAYAIDTNPSSNSNATSNNMSNYGGTPYGEIVGVLPNSCHAALGFLYSIRAEKCRKDAVDNLSAGQNIHQLLKDNLVQRGYCGTVNIRTESWSDNLDPSTSISYASKTGNAFDGTMQLPACPVTVLPPSIRVLLNPSRTPFIANEQVSTGRNGQYYALTVEVSNGPTTAPISFKMQLPAGVTLTNGSQVYALSSNMICTGASFVNCTIPAGAPIGNMFAEMYVDVANSTSNAQASITAVGGGDAKCTGNAPACTASTGAVGVLDAVGETLLKPALTASTTDVSANDKSPANSEYTLGAGSTCANAAISKTGIATYTSPAAVVNAYAACTVQYKLCAAAPSKLVCKQATLTVSTQAAINSNSSGNVVIADNPEKDPVPPIFQVTKTVSNNPLFIGKSGQFYTVNLSVTNGNVSAPILLLDKLPAGISTSGAITAVGGVISNCPAAGATDLAGCTVTVKPNIFTVVVTIPVNVAQSATSGANTATIKNGGSALCTGIAPACSSGTGPVAIVEPVDAVDDTVSQPASGNYSFNVAANDKYPPGSTFNGPVSSSCLSASISAGGVANYALPAYNSAAPTCLIQYQVCAPVASQAGCDSAYLRVTAYAVTAVGDAISVSPNTIGNFNVASNDVFPPGAQFSYQALGSTCLNAQVSSTGVAGFMSPASGATCAVKYQLCAPAPYQTTCSSGNLNVSAAAATGCASLALTYQAVVPANSPIVAKNTAGSGCSFFASSTLLPAGSYKMAGSVVPFGTSTPQVMPMVTFTLSTTGLLKGKAEYDTTSSTWKLVQVP